MPGLIDPAINTHDDLFRCWVSEVVAIDRSNGTAKLLSQKYASADTEWRYVPVKHFMDATISIDLPPAFKEGKLVSLVLLPSESRKLLDAPGQTIECHLANEEIRALVLRDLLVVKEPLICTVSAAQRISKYIGETEKHLRR
ncbi:MAG: hypothetical protein ACX94D_01095 [Henriciella sp.]